MRPKPVNKISRTKVALVAIMMVTLVAASTMITKAYAAPTTIVQARGTGSYTCSDGTENQNLNMDFKAQKDKGKVSGSWFVLTPDFNQIAGEIYGGKIGKTSVNLLAIVDFFNSGPCPNDHAPSKGTITAQCGEGTKVEFKFENGEHGTFTSNVVCHF
jgi:hypothetical protein